MTIEERAADKKDQAVSEEIPEILIADPTEALAEKAPIETTVTELATRAKESPETEITGNVFPESVREMTQRSQETSMANLWTTGSRAERVKTKVIYFSKIDGKNLAQQKLNEEMDNYWKAKEAEKAE